MFKHAREKQKWGKLAAYQQMFCTHPPLCYQRVALPSVPAFRASTNTRNVMEKVQREDSLQIVEMEEQRTRRDTPTPRTPRSAGGATLLPRLRLLEVVSCIAESL